MRSALDMQSKTMHMEGSVISMKGLSVMLTQLMMSGGNANGREVFDKTDLKGCYEVSLDFLIENMIPKDSGTNGSASEASDSGGAGATLFDSVRKMGLKLESSEAPVAQVVVTHAEKMPTEN